MQISSLLSKSAMVYEYMREKPWVKTYMTVKPMKILSEKHIRGLGFRLGQVTKKDSQILLNPKEDDLRVKLILAHYSMQLIPAFLIEGCLSIFLKSEVLTDDYHDGKPIEMRPLFDITNLYESIFRNESFATFSVSKEIMLQRVGFFVAKGYLKFSEDRT